MLHSPVQILEPASNSCFCEDAAAARATRRKVLGWAADNNALSSHTSVGLSGKKVSGVISTEP
jgi:hypothetical protein